MSAGRRDLRPVSELVVPIFEADRKMNNEREIIAPGIADSLPNDFRQFEAIRI